MVAARSPRSAAEVARHTGPFTDVSPGALGWLVLRRENQTPEALGRKRENGKLTPFSSPRVEKGHFNIVYVMPSTKPGTWYNSHKMQCFVSAFI